MSPKLSPVEQAFYKQVGACIRELRRSAKGGSLNQTELANALGVKQHTVSRWERGRFKPTMFEAVAIARFFDVPLGRLFLEEVPRAIPGNSGSQKS